MRIPTQTRDILRMASRLGITLKREGLTCDFLMSRRACFITMLGVASGETEMFIYNAGEKASMRQGESVFFKVKAIEAGFEGYDKEYLRYRTETTNIPPALLDRYYKVGQAVAKAVGY
jgi:hypothetical protein